MALSSSVLFTDPSCGCTERPSGPIGHDEGVVFRDLCGGLLASSLSGSRHPIPTALLEPSRQAHWEQFKREKCAPQSNRKYLPR